LEMKTAIFPLAILAGASAFVPAFHSKTTSVLNERPSPESRALTDIPTFRDGYEGMIGYDVENGNKFFDPVGLSDWIPAEYCRKAELANGRVAMLATVGWFWPTFVGMFPSKDVTTADPIKAIMQTDPQFWAQFIILCGTCEFVKYQGELEGKSYTGDGPAVVDWMGQWDTYSDEKKKDIRLRELKNGRLAMLGMASFVSAHFIKGSVPFLIPAWTS